VDWTSAWPGRWPMMTPPCTLGQSTAGGGTA
jgi:hypothetical protein